MGSGMADARCFRDSYARIDIAAMRVGVQRERRRRSVRAARPECSLPRIECDSSDVIDGRP